VGKPELDNLVKVRSLKAEPPSRTEFDGMLKSARGGLRDAQSEHIESDSRFVLATEAAHKFALAALRREGYRSENRITVFQALVHTVGVPNADLQTFLAAHNERNLASYEGRVDIDEALLRKLIEATKRLEIAVGKLVPPSK
jgi:hypothetical protein